MLQAETRRYFRLEDPPIEHGTPHRGTLHAHYPSFSCRNRGHGHIERPSAEINRDNVSVVQHFIQCCSYGLWIELHFCESCSSRRIRETGLRQILTVVEPIAGGTEEDDRMSNHCSGHVLSGLAIGLAL